VGKFGLTARCQHAANQCFHALFCHPGTAAPQYNASYVLTVTTEWKHRFFGQKQGIFGASVSTIANSSSQLFLFFGVALVSQGKSTPWQVASAPQRPTRDHCASASAQQDKPPIPMPDDERLLLLPATAPHLIDGLLLQLTTIPASDTNSN
jgi:hypothetical protein